MKIRQYYPVSEGTEIYTIMTVKRMLVDATHQEETRIVVVNDNQLEEFDFESSSRLQLRGNIYLAKVTRVEPSLQACFVDYGGNRHGFLAFSEIHPDYYHIPVADKEALLAAQMEQENDDDTDIVAEQTGNEKKAKNGKNKNTNDGKDEDNKSPISDDEQEIEIEAEEQLIDSIGSDDSLDDEVAERKKPLLKRYKIQEVIKRRQVMLVQVVKEERGNKGAALTTYLSLAGRYSVLMPNTAKGGGISRKITNVNDRKRLKEIANSLAVPEGMGVILRTAGASRTKAEIKRDFEYLMRLWENVRTLTLNSTAPCLVYEEGSLIKRAIRDLYSKEIDELLVAGTKAYSEAKEFMRMIMPSHVKKVKLYKDEQPIFSKYDVEQQLDSMFSPKVNLPSGGYIIINPTEALVSIDVNSGKATKERNIEATALQTNLEAAQEVARQLRLRDMAGLVVIDFIDMLERRSNRSVEAKLKEALRNDRARIQVGRISPFGLLEMSRQRMRFGVLESSTNICPTCQGAGIVRSVESVALMVVRAIEDFAQKKPGIAINVRVCPDVANFILNAKRESLSALESKNNISISVFADINMLGNNYAIEPGEKRQIASQNLNHISVDSTGVEHGESRSGENGRPSNKKRRRSKKSKDNSTNIEANDNDLDNNLGDEQNTKETKKRRRRPNRRNARRNNRNIAETEEIIEQADDDENIALKQEQSEEETLSEDISNKKEEVKKPKKRGRKKAANNNETPPLEEQDSEKSEKKKRTAKKSQKKSKKDENNEEKDASKSEEIIVTSSTAQGKDKGETAKKGGWWQRGFFS